MAGKYLDIDSVAIAEQWLQCVLKNGLESLSAGHEM